ncbi:hypothetical protein [Armatimonas rosea]|uniref:Uncharacterized protein n=1 Tax=Armatimonas rosea TaxID=685828 RepID=A0A7W9SRX8_ARMRO|nr:hypothetical protein [Armatimonas rosea]MBB6051725.1 hypothetical protein [Armatimonas rosea]
MPYRAVAIFCGLLALLQAYWVLAMESDDHPKNAGAALNFCYSDLEHASDQHAGVLPNLHDGQALCKSFQPPLRYNPAVAGRKLQTLSQDTWMARTQEPLGERVWAIGPGGISTQDRPDLLAWRFWSAGGFSICLAALAGGAARRQRRG